MSWKMKSNRMVVHSKGHSIELKAGTWQDPYEIHPKIMKGTASLETVKLIREGIQFATAKSKVPDLASS